MKPFNPLTAMTMRAFLARAGAVAAAAALVAALAPAAASADGAPYTYVQDTNLAVGAHTLRILAGSQRQDIAVGASSLTVTLAAGQAFIVRYPGPQPKALENDALQDICHVISTLDNQMVLNGPITATITPSDSSCVTTGKSADATPLITVSQPNGGQSLKAGDVVQVFWTNAGTATSGVRLSYSADGGQTWTLIADNVLNNGFYQWTVPTITTTSQARLRVDGIDQGRVVAFDLSDADFSIEGTPPPATPPASSAEPYDPDVATAEADSIDTNQGFSAQNAVLSPCVAGLRIKGQHSTAVYYCGADGKRHAFPNQRIHDSWFSGFSGVVTVTDDTLAQIPLGANVKYRPGVRMIKITSDPKVYAVDANGRLRWVQEEASALALYGADWNKQIDDVSDAFFTDYAIGDPVPLP